MLARAVLEPLGCVCREVSDGATALAAVEGEPYDLRLFRLDRSGSEIKVAAYDQTTLDTSIDMSLEVR